MYTIFKLQFEDNSVYIGCTCSASVADRVRSIKATSVIDWSFHYDTMLCKKFRESDKDPKVEVLATDILFLSSARQMRDIYRSEYRKEKLLQYD